MLQHDLFSPRDLKDISNIFAQSFASTPDAIPAWLKTAGDDNIRVVRRGKELLAGYLQIPMGQFFGGRSLPMVGIAGVAVAPTARGAGVAKLMMADAIRELASRNIALSTLYPATQRLYRAVGYERAGKSMVVSMPTDGFVQTRSSSLTIRELTEQHQQEVSELYRRVAVCRDGYLDRGPYNWSRVRSPRGNPATGYGFFGEAGIEAYAYFRSEAEDESGFYAIRFSDLQAATAQGYCALAGFIASLRSMGRKAIFRAEANNPLLFTVAEPRYVESSKEDWMLRIVDVKRALGLRGYAHAIATELTLGVSDELVEKNNGLFCLTVSKGRGKVTRGARPDIELDIRGLAPLYSGYLSAFDLAALGLLSGKSAALERAQTLFAGRAPGMCEMY